MPNIPADIIARVEKAISASRCTEAQLILHQFFPALKQTNQLVEALSTSADSAEFKRDYSKARTFYELAISLYEKCLSNMHAEGLHAIRRYAEMLRQSGDHERLSKLLERAGPLITRLGKSAMTPD